MSYIMGNKLTKKALDNELDKLDERLKEIYASENSTTTICNNCGGIVPDGWNVCPCCLIQRIARGDK